MRNPYAASGHPGRERLLLLLLLLLPLLAARAQVPAWAEATTGSATQANGTSLTRAAATDGNGNVFVTGVFTGTVAFGSALLSSAGGQDLFVAKYVPATATWAWAQSGGGLGDDAGNGIAVSGGSVYITGQLTNNTANASGVLFGGTGTTPGTARVNGASASNSADLLLAKYTDNGATATFGWAHVGGGGTEYGSGVAVSGSSVYVTGSIFSSSVNANGVLFGGTGTTPGTVPVYGASPTNSPDLLLAKYLDNGTSAALGWVQVGGGTSTDIGQSVAVSGGSVYVTGQINTNAANANGVVFGSAGTTPGTVPVNGATAANSPDLLLAKYTDNGVSATLSWAQVGGGTSGDAAYGVAVSGSNLYVTGNITNATGNDNGVLFGSTGTTPGTVPVYGASATSSTDLVLAKYTDNGATASLGWTQVGGGTSADVGYAVAASGGNVYVTGVVNNNAANANAVLFGGAGTVPVNGAGATVSNDLVLAKYLDNGASAALAWTQVGGGTGSDVGIGIAVSGQDVLVGGYVTPTASFGGLTIASPAMTLTAVLARVVDPTLTPLASRAAGSSLPGASLTLYPNPVAGGTAQVRGAAPGTVVLVHDALGRTVASALADATGTAALRLPAGLPAGVYAARAGARAVRLTVE